MYLVGEEIYFFFSLRGLIVLAWQQFLAVKLLQFEVASENRYCKAKFKKKKPNPKKQSNVLGG